MELSKCLIAQNNFLWYNAVNQTENIERDNKMKKGICLALLLASIASAAFAYTYDTRVPLPGKSIAGNRIQQETLFTAYSFAHRIATPDCTEFSIVDTKLSQPKINDSWQEIWSIKACQKTALVPIDFSINNDGTLKYAIDPMNVRYKK